MMYSFSGYNNIFGSKHLVDYSCTDLCIADLVRKVRHLYGFNSPCEGLINPRRACAARVTVVGSVCLSVC